jgi:hypothetical protein
MLLLPLCRRALQPCDVVVVVAAIAVATTASFLFFVISPRPYSHLFLFLPKVYSLVVILHPE